MTKHIPMRETRWKLAVERWVTNQQKQPTLKNAKRQNAVTNSTQVIKPGSKQDLQSVTVQQPANNEHTEPKSDGNVLASVTVASDGNVLQNNERYCEFCHEVFTFKNPRAKFCTGTCRQDAYLVRKAFRDGIAQQYILDLLSRNEATR